MFGIASGLIRLHTAHPWTVAAVARINTVKRRSLFYHTFTLIEMVIRKQENSPSEAGPLDPREVARSHGRGRLRPPPGVRGASDKRGRLHSSHRSREVEFPAEVLGVGRYAHAAETADSLLTDSARSATDNHYVVELT